ncbi:MAG: efflux RND transporter permease subunit, partial [Candidatus Gracilibacteria bacterium]|nr:efflux RND transporter permease subunit [Candidatus Gracilibacteria bacterium]
MFKNIAEFFIKNSKLTFVLVFVSLGVGIASYFALPKQYNPTIVVPAFSIQIPSYGLDSFQVSKNIVTPVENLVMEIEGIDEVYGYSYDNMAGIMAKFKVGVPSEDAKIRINQKINENLSLKPYEIGTPIIKSIDPEDLPQITYSINYIGNNLDNIETQIYLRQIANIIKDEVKKVPNVTTMEIVGGEKKDIYIELDLDKIKAKNTDILQVYEVLKKYNLNSPSGNIKAGNENVFLEVNGKVENINDLENIVISNINGNELL